MVSEENKKPRKAGCLPSDTDSLNKKMLEREQATELENFKRESERTLQSTGDVSKAPNQTIAR